MLNLVPLFGQECVNEFRNLVPIQYRPGLTPLDKLDNLSKQDFFCIEIRYGLLTIGQIIFKLIPFKTLEPDNQDDMRITYYMDILYVQLIEHMITSSLIEGFLKNLQNIQYLFPKLSILFIQANFLSGILYDSISERLLENNWKLIARFNILKYDPFLDQQSWIQKYFSYQKVYKRVIDQGKYEIVSFDQLSPTQCVALQDAPAPSWALPFNESLASSRSSKHSYAAFFNGIPIAWVIADSYQSGSLYLETCWFQDTYTSPIMIYALFYLIFSKHFGLYGTCGETHFSFRHLANNIAMHRLQRALEPFLTKKSECMCYKFDLIA